MDETGTFTPEFRAHPSADTRSRDMKPSARSIVYALTVVSYLSGSLALAAEPTPDEAHTPLTSVSKRESYVFASTPAGLFRASLATKRWEKLKTPPEMPQNGTFAAQPEKSPLVIYVAVRSQADRTPRRGLRYGLYLSRDDGATWELASERDDFGATLLHPGGALFAVTGADGINSGSRVLRSPDLGKTWRDITGNASGQFLSLGPDPDHPGLIRIHAWGLRTYMLVADDEDYHWKVVRGSSRVTGRRPSDKFFSRGSSSTNALYKYKATLANYFRYDFGNQTNVQALEVVPRETRFEFARGARVVVPIRVVFHCDTDAALAYWRKFAAEGRAAPNPTPPIVKLADQPGETAFWGIRVESADVQVERFPPRGDIMTVTVATTGEGQAVTKTQQSPAVKYRVVDLSPSSPYEREIDLGRIYAFSKPGEYRVQLIYTSGGYPDREKGEWDGSFTSPVFTVVIRE
jgi:hypothetical protein